jgi:hypothetical protein
MLKIFSFDPELEASMETISAIRIFARQCVNTVLKLITTVAARANVKSHVKGIIVHWEASV